MVAMENVVFPMTKEKGIAFHVSVTRSLVHFEQILSP